MGIESYEKNIDPIPDGTWATLRKLINEAMQDNKNNDKFMLDPEELVQIAKQFEADKEVIEQKCEKDLDWFCDDIYEYYEAIINSNSEQDLFLQELNELISSNTDEAKKFYKDSYWETKDDKWNNQNLGKVYRDIKKLKNYKYSSIWITRKNFINDLQTFDIKKEQLKKYSEAFRVISNDEKFLTNIIVSIHEEKNSFEEVDEAISRLKEEWFSNNQIEKIIRHNYNNLSITTINKNIEVLSRVWFDKESCTNYLQYLWNLNEKDLKNIAEIFPNLKNYETSEWNWLFICKTIIKYWIKPETWKNALNTNKQFTLLDFHNFTIDWIKINEKNLSFIESINKLYDPWTRKYHVSNYEISKFIRYRITQNEKITKIPVILLENFFDLYKDEKKHNVYKKYINIPYNEFIDLVVWGEEKWIPLTKKNEDWIEEINTDALEILQSVVYWNKLISIIDKIVSEHPNENIWKIIAYTDTIYSIYEKERSKNYKKERTLENPDTSKLTYPKDISYKDLQEIFDKIPFPKDNQLDLDTKTKKLDYSTYEAKIWKYSNTFFAEKITNNIEKGKRLSDKKLKIWKGLFPGYDDNTYKKRNNICKKAWHTSIKKLKKIILEYKAIKNVFIEDVLYMIEKNISSQSLVEVVNIYNKKISGKSENLPIDKFIWILEHKIDPDIYFDLFNKVWWEKFNIDSYEVYSRDNSYLIDKYWNSIDERISKINNTQINNTFDEYKEAREWMSNHWWTRLLYQLLSSDYTPKNKSISSQKIVSRLLEDLKNKPLEFTLDLWWNKEKIISIDHTIWSVHFIRMILLYIQ